MIALLALGGLQARRRRGTNPGAPPDFDGDGVVPVPDLLTLLATWSGPGPCDFDESGAVAVPDLLGLLANWGTCQ